MNLHDNAPAHQTKNGIRVLLQPPRSPNPNPADNCLLLRIKALLKGCRFQSAEEVSEITIMPLTVTGRGIYKFCQQRSTNFTWGNTDAVLTLSHIKESRSANTEVSVYGRAEKNQAEDIGQEYKLLILYSCIFFPSSTYFLIHR
jgi:hypothetical protein